MAAVVVLLDSAASAAAALLVPVLPVRVVPLPVPHEPELPALPPPVLVQVPPGLRVLVQVLVVLAQVPPRPLLLHLLSMPLPQVVVESEVRARHQGRQSFSAAMARSSPPTGKPTYERAASTR